MYMYVHNNIKINLEYQTCLIEWNVQNQYVYYVLDTSVECYCLSNYISCMFWPYLKMC